MREIDQLRSELSIKAYESDDFDEEDWWQHWVEVLDQAAELLWQYSDLCD
jgi:hypothetical protein